MFTPVITGNLRKHLITMPEASRNASGIIINGKKIRSLVFSTDVAIIRNTNANGIIAVYPFTAQTVITQAIMSVADVPVFCGVGGGVTTGTRSINLALHAEFQGAAGVVVNAPMPDEVIAEMAEEIDIPIIVTVPSEHTDFEGRLKAGASIFNVAAAAKTPDVVRLIREKYPEVPIIATGGPDDETVQRTIDAGANCVTFTPPKTGELYRVMMEKYREQCL